MPNLSQCKYPFGWISLAQAAITKYILNAKLVSLLQLAPCLVEMHAEQITESQSTEMNAKFVMLSFAPAQHPLWDEYICSF